jgi:hypothetical protein
MASAIGLAERCLPPMNAAMAAPRFTIAVGVAVVGGAIAVVMGLVGALLIYVVGVGKCLRPHDRLSCVGCLTAAGGLHGSGGIRKANAGLAWFVCQPELFGGVVSYTKDHSELTREWLRRARGGRGPLEATKVRPSGQINPAHVSREVPEVNPTFASPPLHSSPSESAREGGSCRHRFPTGGSLW